MPFSSSKLYLARHGVLLIISSSVEWNLDVVSQFMAADFSHLNWQLVARNLDFPEFSIHGTKQLEVLLRLYHSGPRGYYQLPLYDLTAESRSGQSSLSRHLLAVSPNNTNFPYTDEALDASTVVERGRDVERVRRCQW